MLDINGLLYMLLNSWTVLLLFTVFVPIFFFEIIIWMQKYENVSDACFASRMD